MSVTYQWVTTGETGYIAYITQLTGYQYSLGSLTFSDQAVASGTFSAWETGCDVYYGRGCYAFTGDPSQLVVTSLIPGSPPTSPPMDESIHLSFDADGTLSGDIYFATGYTGYWASGTGNSWTAYIGSDAISPCEVGIRSCGVTGYWVDPPALTADLTAVPEPASMVIFAAALLSLALVRMMMGRDSRPRR